LLDAARGLFFSIREVLTEFELIIMGRIAVIALVENLSTNESLGGVFMGKIDTYNDKGPCPLNLRILATGIYQNFDELANFLLTRLLGVIKLLYLCLVYRDDRIFVGIKNSFQQE
jgi:hypothetical protein